MPIRDTNPTQGFHATENQLDWGGEESYWRQHFTSRPYATADRGFDYYRPGYRYGFEAGQKHQGRKWEDVEPDLQKGWDRYEHRGASSWEHVKHAVRDAWDRVVHR